MHNATAVGIVNAAQHLDPVPVVGLRGSD